MEASGRGRGGREVIGRSDGSDFMARMQSRQTAEKDLAGQRQVANERNAFFAVACALIRKAGGRVDLSDDELDMHPMQQLDRTPCQGGHTFTVSDPSPPDKYPLDVDAEGNPAP